MAKVLVIEDEFYIRESIVDTLEFAAYEVAVAADGFEGIRLAQTFEPDLILCDIMMPALDGYGVLIELSQIPQTAAIPFIFLTAKAAREDIRKGMALGADDYLTKPFTSPELLAAVQSRLDRHRQLDKHHVQQMESIRRYINLSLPHELRTPLTGVLGYLSMLLDGFETWDNDMVEYMLKSAMRSANRLSDLIENYIAYSHLQLIKLDPNLTAKLYAYSNLTDLHELIVQEAEKQATKVERFKDLVLDVVPGDVFMYYEHAQKLLNVVLSNALKFSEAGTPIAIQGYKESRYYIITVSNDGRGMTADQIALIGENRQFERETYEQQGVGLGLVIAKLIVEVYRGEMKIESESGKNLTVLLKLSLLEEAGNNV